MAETRGTTQKKLRKGAATKLASARDSALERARVTVGQLEANPMGVLVGGLAFGLLAGALIPRSAKEKSALAPLGKRLSDGASAALAAAKETGKEQLNASMISRDAAKEGARKVFDSAVNAAKGSKPA